MAECRPSTAVGHAQPGHCLTLSIYAALAVYQCKGESLSSDVVVKVNQDVTDRYTGPALEVVEVLP